MLPDYHEMADDVLDSFLRAVDAYKRGDCEGMVSALRGPSTSDDSLIYAWVCGLVYVAAAATGYLFREITPVPPGGFYGFELLHTETGKSVSPNDSPDAANAVAAGRMVTAAANGDDDMLIDLVAAHIPPQGPAYRAKVVFDLIGLYAAADESLETQRG